MKKKILNLQEINFQLHSYFSGYCISSRTVSFYLQIGILVLVATVLVNSVALQYPCYSARVQWFATVILSTSNCCIHLCASNQVQMCRSRLVMFIVIVVIEYSGLNIYVNLRLRIAVCISELYLVMDVCDWCLELNLLTAIHFWVIIVCNQSSIHSEIDVIIVVSVKLSMLVVELRSDIVIGVRNIVFQWSF